MGMTKPTDEVVHEYPTVGKYRVRVLKKGTARVLDVREYITTDSFEGFTRKGVRLDGAGVALLESFIKDALDRGWFEVKAEAPKGQ